MSDFVLMCESTADRDQAFFESRDIKVVNFHYELDGKIYDDDLYSSISAEEFFAKIAAGAMPKTSQLSVGEYEQIWTPYLEAGEDVLHVTLSSGISGTYDAACVATELLRERFPEHRVRVVDSLAASSGYGLLMEYAADVRDDGASLDEVADWIEEHRLNVHHWFFSTDLTSFKRGGRISATSALLGTALKICPLMNVDYEGHLIPRKKIRTKKRAMAEMVKTCLDHIDDGPEYTGKCIMSHSACREDAEEVARMVGEQIPALKDNIKIYDIGTVIGAHTGPGTVTLFFMGDKRVD